MKTQTPIESILDEMDFTHNEHILKNAHKIKQQEKEFWQKENQNIYLNRLKEQYKESKVYEMSSLNRKYRRLAYDAMRLFCLDTQLVSFNDIEAMEDEVNQSFS